MKRILIIEDDASIAELERDYLEIEGFDIQWVDNGQTGLRKALDEDFSLILLDVMLPGLDGFAVCRAIRKEKETPIMMVTAKREDIDKIRGLGLGADDYMIKPFNPAEMVARVKAHIQRYERVSRAASPVEDKVKSTIITAGPMVIDQDSRIVTIDDVVIALTPREYDILLLLASNAGRVFTKEEIFERVWGLDAMGETSTIMVHIKRLREKIELPNRDVQLVETVWGVGYRFHKWVD
ncbi:response regulator transcription factor [Veillonella caviae]|uniref:response regulator transcription factor n=1 Tax=Veillonella caviae TaxID=248316 RepID=UPI0023F8A1B2|nr:response regulator transcription factor [Veillonella caviae]MCI7693854.1 response regulator transcription factor [Veillonella caviae]MDD7290333.1 response regulator transcription factor [Veillonella caviae]MDY5253883.1 response regulator transcription factor [Veillonella caviae]MDY5787293.1 response regulator transcription factor [Veillonella caviae]